MTASNYRGLIALKQMRSRPRFSKLTPFLEADPASLAIRQEVIKTMTYHPGYIHDRPALEDSFGRSHFAKALSRSLVLPKGRYLVQGYTLNQQRLEAQQEKFAEIKQAIALSARLAVSELRLFG